MAELGGAAGFALEPLHVVAVGQQTGMGNLQCNNTVELGIAGPPHGAERPLAHLAHELEPSENPKLDGRCRRADRLGRTQAAAARTGRRLPVEILTRQWTVAIRAA